MRQFFNSMSGRARLAFALGIVLIACIVGAIAWWVSHPPYGVLFSDLRESDAAEITASLGQMQTPYRLTDAGKTILVPDEQVYETRMKLVSQGVPKGGSVGFELFKDSDYGVTEFAQKVNFQRALQGELERTIDSLQEVASSRVHLTIRRSGLFEREQEPSKASVTLNLRPQQHLDARGIVGVQRLVASAVDGLTAESVVVLDDKGMVLSAHAAEGQGGVQVGDRLDEQSRLEAQLKSRVGELLHRVLLMDDFTVSVDVRLNYDHVKQVSEHLIAQGKDGNGLLVHEKANATGHTDDSDPTHVKIGSVSNDHELDYAHGREQIEVDQAPGRVERISVGIVIPAALPQNRVDALTSVVSASLGLDATRGDKVDIAAIAPPLPRTAAPAIAPAAPSDASAGAASPLIATSAHVDARWMPWLFVAIAVLLLGVLLTLLARRQPVPRRLSAPERKEALAQLRQWIESSEVER